MSTGTGTSRFEQRRKEGGIDHKLVQAGVKKKPGMAYVHLQNAYSPADLDMQQEIYWGEGYDHAGTTPQGGLIMEIPREEVEKNVARYQKDSEDRLRRTKRTDLDNAEGVSNNRDTLEESKPMSVRDFFRTSEKADPTDEA